MRTRLDSIRERIRAAAERAGRTPDQVTLVAVTKGVPAAHIRAAAALGVQDVGESRLQEALPKISALEDVSLCWHLVGHLQRNKARRAAELFGLVHSVDSRSLAEALARHGEAQGRPVRVLLQVNVAVEATKQGFNPRELMQEARGIARLMGLRVEGLMTVAPMVRDPEEVRPVFRRLRALGQALQEDAAGAHHLSMGMSDDFEVAIEEGATLIRVGRALFSGRVTRKTPSG